MTTDLRLSTDESDFLRAWRATLHRRADQAVDRLSAIPTVRGLILAGGVGRGAEWPLSDIDVIGIYSDNAFEQTKAEVDVVRTALMTAWTEEGFSTPLDIKGIVFAEREIAAAASTTGSSVVPLLTDKRFFHGMDKAHGGQVRYDPSGLVTAFLSWINHERYSADVTAARVEEKRRIRDQALRQAHDQPTDRVDSVDLSLAVDASIVANILLLMEVWGDRGSVRRGPTFAERRATSEGEHDVISELFRLRRFDVDTCQGQMATAPGHVWRYSEFAWEARRQVSEEVTDGQNERDAVVLEGARVLRDETPPYKEWVGVDCNRDSVERRLESLGELRASHHLLKA